MLRTLDVIFLHPSSRQHPCHHHLTNNMLVKVTGSSHKYTYPSPTEYQRVPNCYCCYWTYQQAPWLSWLQLFLLSICGFRRLSWELSCESFHLTLSLNPSPIQAMRRNLRMELRNCTSSVAVQKLYNPTGTHDDNCATLLRMPEIQ